MSFRKKIYSLSPLVLKSVLADLYTIKESKHRYSGLDLISHMYRDDILELKKTRLSDHLLAANGCEYWNEYFKKNGITIDDIITEPFKVYETLPILNKWDVVGQESQFVNRGIDKKELRKISTSGSTGGALNFYETKISELERWGVWWRYRERLGIKKEMRLAYFGGKSIVPIGNVNPPYWVGGIFSNQLNFSVYHISMENIELYVNEINKFAPEWIHGYPSALYAIAKLSKEKGIKVTCSVKYITIGSESLLDYQKELIESFFGVSVKQHYGLSESVA
ncbi:hypothetical protein, partial [Vibrio parahaemolyticus]